MLNLLATLVAWNIHSFWTFVGFECSVPLQRSAEPRRCAPSGRHCGPVFPGSVPPMRTIENPGAHRKDTHEISLKGASSLNDKQKLRFQWPETGLVAECCRGAFARRVPRRRVCPMDSALGSCRDTGTCEKIRAVIYIWKYSSNW